MILLGDVNAHNPPWGSKKMSTRGRMLEKILDRFNLLYLNKNKETYYRTDDACKSPIDLTLVNLTIAPEYKWSKNSRWNQEKEKTAALFFGIEKAYDKVNRENTLE